MITIDWSERLAGKKGTVRNTGKIDIKSSSPLRLRWGNPRKRPPPELNPRPLWKRHNMAHRVTVVLCIQKLGGDPSYNGPKKVFHGKVPHRSHSAMTLPGGGGWGLLVAALCFWQPNAKGARCWRSHSMHLEPRRMASLSCYVSPGKITKEPILIFPKQAIKSGFGAET